jgi:hypothetical protein
MVAFFVKYLVLIILAFTMKYQNIDSSYFREAYLTGQASLSPVEAQEFTDFQEYSSDIRDFVFNQMLEVIVLGMLANYCLLSWILEGEVTKLSENWEYKDDALEDIREDMEFDDGGSSLSGKTLGLSAIRGRPSPERGQKGG